MEVTTDNESTHYRLNGVNEIDSTLLVVDMYSRESVVERLRLAFGPERAVMRAGLVARLSEAALADQGIVEPSVTLTEDDARLCIDAFRWCLSTQQRFLDSQSTRKARYSKLLADFEHEPGARAA